MSRRWILSTLVLGVALIALTVIPAVGSAASRGSGSVSSWFTRWGDSVGTALADWWPGTLRKQNSILRRQLLALSAENSDLSTRIHEVRAWETLRTALGDRAGSVVAARVVLRSSNPAEQTFTIDRGTADHLSVGAAVLGERGFVVGRVRFVQDHSADVLLLTDPASRLTVQAGPNSSPGVLMGDRGILARLTNVSRDAALSIGSSVATAGIDTGVPRGLPVGDISELTTRPADLFQTATVVLPAVGRGTIVVAVVVQPTP